MAENYPVATVAETPPVATVRTLTPEEQIEVDTLYAELHPAAIGAYWSYINARTPPALWPAMKTLAEADAPAPIAPAA